VINMKKLHKRIFWGFLPILLLLSIFTFIGCPEYPKLSYEDISKRMSKYTLDHGYLPSFAFRQCFYNHPDWGDKELEDCAIQYCVDQGFSRFDCGGD